MITVGGGAHDAPCTVTVAITPVGADTHIGPPVDPQRTPTALYRKVTTRALVQAAPGEKVVAEVPAVIPFSTAQSTAL